MAVIWTEGFDMYNGIGAGTGLQAKWYSVFGSISGDGRGLTSGRFGGQAFYTSASGFGAGNTNRTFNGAAAVVSPSTVLTSFAMGVAVKLSSTSMFNIGGYRMIEFWNGSGAAQFGIGCTNTGQIVAYLNNNASVIGTSSAIGVVSPGGWNYFEVEADVSTTTGNINVYFNGALVLALTGINNCAQGGGVQILAIGTPEGVSDGSNITFDDIYFVNTHTRLGERRIETLRPTSDYSVGFAPSSGGSNYAMVNETFVDGDTTYVSSSTVGARDLYHIGSLTSTPIVIDCVNIITFAEKTDATTRQLANSVQSAGVDSDGTAFNLNGTYNRYDRIMTTDPATGTSWTASGVNNLLIGPKVIS